MLLVPSVSPMAIMGPKVVVGTGIWDQPFGSWAEAPAYGSCLILITVPNLATKDLHAFPACFSEPCQCSYHCLECPSQPPWGHSGLSYNVTSSLIWLAELPVAASPGFPCTWHVPLLALSPCHYYYSSSCLPHQMVVPSRQGPIFLISVPPDRSCCSNTLLVQWKASHLPLATNMPAFPWWRTSFLN